MRFDAGYPGEPPMAALEERGTHYVARVRNNAVLKRLALPAIDEVVWDALNNGPAGGGEPRAWVREESYRAGVVVPFPPGRAGGRRAAGRTHPALLLAAYLDARRRGLRRGAPGRSTASAARRRATWGS